MWKKRKKTGRETKGDMEREIGGDGGYSLFFDFDFHYRVFFHVPGEH